jgi:hypothetical protein
MPRGKNVSAVTVDVTGVIVGVIVCATTLRALRIAAIVKVLIRLFMDIVSVLE